MRQVHPDAIVGGVLLVFSVGIYLIVPIEIQELIRYDASMGLSPAVFPKLSAFLIAGFSAVLIFSALRPKDVAPREGRRALGMGSRARVITTFMIILVYVYLIGILGYLVITPLALIILMWYFGERRWLLILSIAILTTAGLFGFFRYIMYIILPEGVLFS